MIDDLLQIVTPANALHLILSYALAIGAIEAVKRGGQQLGQFTSRGPTYVMACALGTLAAFALWSGELVERVVVGLMVGFTAPMVFDWLKGKIRKAPEELE